MTKLSKRLTAAAQAVRPGAVIADVGTDHAYLPIYLWEMGRIRGGVASDINEGPLERARLHLHVAGLGDRISTVLCDGLCAIRPYAPTDILILGMGGELIARILQEAPWIRKQGIRLILQPMTHPEEVRNALGALGFSIAEERIVLEEKLYQIITADYTGEQRESTESALLPEPAKIVEGLELFAALCHRYEAVFLERKRGKASAGLNTEEEEKLLCLLASLQEKGGNQDDRS